MSLVLKKAVFDGWNTPPRVLDRVYEYGTISLDPCSNERSQVISMYKLTKEQDGLSAPWKQLLGQKPNPLVFVNPPFDSKTIYKVVKKCIEEKALGCEIMLLVPSKTEQPWYQSALESFDSVCHIAKRVNFYKDGVEVKGSQFACVIFYTGNDIKRFKNIFNSLGKCVNLQEIEK